MRDLFLGLLGGVLLGSGVALIQANIAKSKYESQGQQLGKILQAQGQQVQNALVAGGASFRTELTAVARASATAIAIGRAVTVLSAYGLDASTLAKLERLS